jgi:flagellin-like protein
MRPRVRSTGRKAVSPVIATVILVAVTIVIALAVAFWLSGIASSLQQTERLEVRVVHTGPQKVHLHVRNLGSGDVSITEVLVLQQGDTVDGASPPDAFSLTPGEATRLVFDHGVGAGQSFEVVLITASGNQYRATATTP